MSKKMEKLLVDQEKMSKQINLERIHGELDRGNEMLLSMIQKDLKQEEAQELQDEYEAYKKVKEEMLKESGEVSFEDVQAKLPDNAFVKLLQSFGEAAKKVDLEEGVPSLEKIVEIMKNEEE